MQGGLVGLDHRHVMGLLVLDEPLEVALDGVQGIAGDHVPGQVQALKEGRKWRVSFVLAPTSVWARVTGRWWVRAERR
ncbi:hypothetical protein GCM10026982_54940 [Nocardiopsis aegyptia]